MHIYVFTFLNIDDVNAHNRVNSRHWTYQSVMSYRYTSDKGNNKITELRTILQRESQNS